MKHRTSDYMHWAKTQSKATFNLSTSGVRPFRLRDLPWDPGALEINGDDSYGYRPLLEAIAAKYGVDPDCIVTSAGTSMSNHLVLAALLEPGDEVLIEHPVYELIVSAARYLGASIKHFQRSEESGYAVDPAEVRRALTPKTKLIVITNLHNPSSALTPNSVLQEIGDLARGAGARVMVDEVYLDAVYQDTSSSSFHLGPEFVVTNSLTKVYGLSGLRSGWILAEPNLARSMWRLNDLFSATPAHPAELLSVAAFQHLGTIRERARGIVQADRELLDRFLASESKISAPRTQWGTTAFIRYLPGGTDAFLERLRADYQVSAVPGRFFGMPEHFRIGMGVDSRMFAEGLNRITNAIHGG